LVLRSVQVDCLWIWHTVTKLSVILCVSCAATYSFIAYGIAPACWSCIVSLYGMLCGAPPLHSPGGHAVCAGSMHAPALQYGWLRWLWGMEHTCILKHPASPQRAFSAWLRNMPTAALAGMYCIVNSHGIGYTTMKPAPLAAVRWWRTARHACSLGLTC
jgi:hypothetical protein